MKILLTLLTVLTVHTSFAGGVHCKECPAESDACMPLPNCKISHTSIETCTYGDITVMIKTKNSPRVSIDQIDLFKDGKLQATQYGPLRAQACHVQGLIYTGKVFIYGGCSQFGDPEAKLLTDRQTNISYDLNQFSCRLQ